MLKLKELRKIYKYSQEDVANLIDSTNQTISNWENNKTEPCINDLKKLADVFHVSVDYLIDHNPKEKSVSEIKTKLKTLSKDELVSSLEEILHALDK